MKDRESRFRAWSFIIISYLYIATFFVAGTFLSEDFSEDLSRAEELFSRILLYGYGLPLSFPS